MTPLIGFAPDMPSTTPGVITDCIQLIPSERGMKAAPSAVSVSGVSALASECRGSVVLQKMDGTRRTFAGTQTKIWELTGTTWTDRGTYTGSSENRWSFAQFGDTSLATNDVEDIQSSSSGSFSAITGAPKARIIITVPNFAIAFNTSDGTTSTVFGDSPDRWWCSAFQNPANWAINVDNQCVSERLVGGGGEITAAGPFGTGWVAYKSREMFQAIYTGSESVFNVQRIPGDQGCIGPEAWADIGGAHAFVGEDNIWVYDGSRPFPIAQGTVRQWFFDDLNATYRYRTIVSYDRNNGRVWVFYPSSASSTGRPDSALVYHLATKRWGRANRSIEAAVNFVTPGLTWDTLDSVAATWDTLPDLPWDSQAWQASGRALAVFDTSHNLKTLTGVGEDSALTTGDVGDEDFRTFVSDVRLRYGSEPSTSSVSGQKRESAGAAGIPGGSGSGVNGNFNLRQTSRFHRFAFQFTGNVEVQAFRVNPKNAGVRR